MKERPILFSAPMIRAILADRKTQTRRVMKCRNSLVDGVSISSETWDYYKFDFANAWVDPGPSPAGNEGPYLKAFACDESVRRIYPRAWRGDVLWVRETFSYERRYPTGTGAAIWRWADGNPTDGDWTKPKPSIHMPRWASRITLKITDVRVERLQEISDDDCEAEGIKQRWTCINPGTGTYAHDNDVRDDYRKLWSDINGAYSWTANPWVWVVSFERVMP